MTVNRAVVLGAGTMGSQIAALLAGHGVECDLLDLTTADGPSRSGLAESAKERLLGMRPPAVEDSSVLSRIHPGNFDDDMDRLSDADWVIEAVAERLDIKRAIWARAAKHVAGKTVVSSNTSGLPIASIAKALPGDMRRRFLGFHFFNPPRYMRLVEVIPTEDTDPAVTDAVERYGHEVLGKGTVIAKDVPGFIANRVGSYGLLATLNAMDEFSLGPGAVDAITGVAMGRPKSATLRTLDLVGIDIFADICDSLAHSIDDQRESAEFALPDYVREMVRRRWTGAKADGGFYVRSPSKEGKELLELRPGSLEYVPMAGFDSPSLAAALELTEPIDRLRTLVESNDDAGRFAWTVLSKGLSYAAQMLGTVADDAESIDKAMRWGFGWDLGPFETWDALGASETKRRMAEDGLRIPPWVDDAVRTGVPLAKARA